VKKKGPKKYCTKESFLIYVTIIVNARNVNSNCFGQDQKTDTLLFPLNFRRPYPYIEFEGSDLSKRNIPGIKYRHSILMQDNDLIGLNVDTFNERLIENIKILQ
jgi:hypothetical protein